MTIFWAAAAQSDLARIYDFLAQYDLQAADSALELLISSPEELLDFPRRGPRLSEFDPREVREFRIGAYVMRYELAGTDLRVLRMFHVREDRYQPL